MGLQLPRSIAHSSRGRQSPGGAHSTDKLLCGQAESNSDAGLTETEMVMPLGKLTSSDTMRWRASGVSGAAEE